MKSNLSSFRLCYRGRDPIFSLEKPHTRSLGNKEILKFHSDTFDRNLWWQSFSHNERTSVNNKINLPLREMTPLLNYWFTNWCVHAPSRNRHHIWPVKINTWKHFRKIEIALFDRAIALSLLPDRGLKLSLDGSRYGREGTCGTILRSLKLFECYIVFRKIWSFVLQANKTCPLFALENQELDKVWQFKTKEKNVSENIPFDLSWVTWCVLLGLVQ